MYGHHTGVQNCSCLTEPRVLTKDSGVNSYCSPITTMSERPLKRLWGSMDRLWVYTPTEAASKDNVCRQNVSKRGSHAPNGHQLLSFTLCLEVQQNQTGLSGFVPRPMQAELCCQLPAAKILVTWVLVSALLLTPCMT